MVQRKYAVCVTTSRPSSTLTPGGGGGAVSLICPYTGSVLSSLRMSGDNSNRSLLGVSSISLFHQDFGTDNSSLMMAIGGTTAKRDDTYGMLLTLRNASLPPILHWKCRLPEAQMSAGITLSPCGYFTAGGSITGNIYIWTFNGNLIRITKAHYRAVEVMMWSRCGTFLITGGADGMVHAFSIADLVDREISENQQIAPYRTWSSHHLTVTSLASVDAHKFVSISEDGKVVLMEVFLDDPLATIQMPHGLTSLTYHEGSLYVGSVQGIIYTIDLAVYAMYQTSQLGVTVKRRKVDQSTGIETVFDLEDNEDCYKSELHGHDKSVTSLAIVEDSNYLVSGDQGGVVRLWHLDSRGCIRVLRPWSHSIMKTSATTANNNKSNTKSTSHPVTSIIVVPRHDEQSSGGQLGSFNNHSSKQAKSESLTNIVGPLKRFVTQGEADGSKEKILIPFLKPAYDEKASKFWDTPSSIMIPDTYEERMNQKKSIVFSDPKSNEVTAESNTTDEISRLKQELEEAKAKIEKWERNNKNKKGRK